MMIMACSPGTLTLSMLYSCEQKNTFRKSAQQMTWKRRRTYNRLHVIVFLANFYSSISSSARTTERSASSATQAKSCRRSHWADWRHRRRRSSLKNRQASEQSRAGTDLHWNSIISDVCRNSIEAFTHVRPWYGWSSALIRLSRFTEPHQVSLNRCWLQLDFIMFAIDCTRDLHSKVRRAEWQTKYAF